MGKANASASAGERERKSLFKLCRCRRGRCRRRSPPRRLPSRRAAWVPGTPSRFEVGASAPPGRGARGGEREGKCSTRAGVSPVRPPRRNPRSCLACNSGGTHPPCLSPEVGASHMGTARCSGSGAGSAARSPVSAPAPGGRCTSPGQCRRDAPALRRIGPAAARSSRGAAGGFQLRLRPRVLAPTLRSAPKPCHLQTQTPDECLKITMLPGLPLSLFLMHGGGQPMGHRATVPTGAHWLAAWQGAGSQPPRLSPLVHGQARDQLF